jgi:tyrosyl-DNA phosphodiesterase 2
MNPLRQPRVGDGGWVDAWLELGGGSGGWTYDAVANPMLKGFNLLAERMRPDRFICKLRDFTLGSIHMLGMEAIPERDALRRQGGLYAGTPQPSLLLAAYHQTET